MTAQRKAKKRTPRKVDKGSDASSSSLTSEGPPLTPRRNAIKQLAEASAERVYLNRAFRPD
jgi:hypothetical protein